MMSRRPAPGCAVPVVPEEASRQKGLTVCRWEACRSASRYAASASASPQYGSQAEPLRPPAPGSVAAAVAGGRSPVSTAMAGRSASPVRTWGPET